MCRDLTNTLYPRGKGRNIPIIKTKDITQNSCCCKARNVLLKGNLWSSWTLKALWSSFYDSHCNLPATAGKTTTCWDVKNAGFKTFECLFYMKTPRGTFKTQKYSNNNNIWYAFSHINIFTSLIDCSSDQQLASLLTCSVKCFIQH